MAWGIDNSTNLTSVHNTMKSCIPCLYIFPHSYATVLAFHSLLALPVKGWSLWLVVSSPIMYCTIKTDLLSFNLLVNDLLLNLTNLLIMSFTILFGQSPQYMWSFLLCLVAFGRPLFQCFLCVECYMAVEHPVVFLKYSPLRYRVALLAPAWMTLLIIGSVSSAMCEIHAKQMPQFLIVQSIVLFLFFVINSFCCASILRALIRPPPGEGWGGRQHKKEV